MGVRGHGGSGGWAGQPEAECWCPGLRPEVCTWSRSTCFPRLHAFPGQAGSFLSGAGSQTALSFSASPAHQVPRGDPPQVPEVLLSTSAVQFHVSGLQRPPTPADHPAPTRAQETTARLAVQPKSVPRVQRQTNKTKKKGAHHVWLPTPGPAGTPWCVLPRALLTLLFSPPYPKLPSSTVWVDSALTEHTRTQDMGLTE